MTTKTKSLFTAAVLAAGIAIGVPLAAAADDESSPATTEAPRPSGIYALTTEQIAFYEGFLAGRGYEVRPNPQWALSALEISALRGAGADRSPEDR
jgi:hypothetical protein